MWQTPCITNFSRSERVIRLLRRRGTRLLYMFRNQIDQVNLISTRCEPARIDARASSGIDDCGSRWREVAENQFLRTRMLELAPALAEARGLVRISIVADNSLDGFAITHRSFAGHKNPTYTLAR